MCVFVGLVVLGYSLSGHFPSPLSIIHINFVEIS